MNRIKRHWPAFVLALIFTLALAPIAFAQDVTSNTQQINGVPTNLMMWGAIIGFLASPIISGLNRQRWSSDVKAVMTFVWCVVGALGTVIFTGQFDLKNLATTVLFVLFSAIGSYNLLYKPSGIAGKIEGKTG